MAPMLSSMAIRRKWRASIGEDSMRGAVLAIAIALACGPAAAQESAPLKAGTEWNIKRTAVDGGVRNDTFAVLGDRNQGGRNFTVVQRGDGLQIWLDKGTRALAFLMQDGKTVESYDPDWGDWRWPLKVGEKWSTTYRLQTGDGRSINGAAGTWTVAAEEDVVVPAGTFKALRIERTPGNQSNHIVIRWFAPDIGLVVKQIDRRTNQRGDTVQEMVGHKLAP
jgi:hypothetical protein